MPNQAHLYSKTIKGKGRAVFCKKAIAKDEIIETSPLLIIPAGDYNAVSTSNLCDYFFHFDKEEGTLAFALGFGSLYNHAMYSNAAYNIDKAARVIRFFALENIQAHTEICINYGGEYGKNYDEWFTARNISLL